MSRYRLLPDAREALQTIRKYYVGRQPPSAAGRFCVNFATIYDPSPHARCEGICELI